MPVTHKSLIRLPTELARRFLSELLGFGVAVALFAAPFLGARRIPWFEPLIAIFPEEQRSFLIPISSFLVGLVALSIQFYAGEAITRKNIRTGFKVILPFVLTSVIALIALYVGFVKKISTVVGDQVLVIGWLRLPTCKCPPGDDEQCLIGLASNLGICWSDGSIAQVKIALFLSYLIAIEGFAVLVGLRVLQWQRTRPQETEQPKKKIPQRSDTSKPANPAVKPKKPKTGTPTPRPKKPKPPE